MPVNIDPRYLSYDKDEVEAILNSVEVFDTTPTAESPRPVTSGGVAAAIDAAAMTYEENSDPASLFE